MQTSRAPTYIRLSTLGFVANSSNPCGNHEPVYSSQLGATFSSYEGRTNFFRLGRFSEHQDLPLQLCCMELSADLPSLERNCSFSSKPLESHKDLHRRRVDRKRSKNDTNALEFILFHARNSPLEIIIIQETKGSEYALRALEIIVSHSYSLARGLRFTYTARMQNSARDLAMSSTVCQCCAYCR